MKVTNFTKIIGGLCSMDHHQNEATNIQLIQWGVNEPYTAYAGCSNDIKHSCVNEYIVPLSPELLLELQLVFGVGEKNHFSDRQRK